MFNLSLSGVLPGVALVTGLGVVPLRGVSPSAPLEGVLDKQKSMSYHTIIIHYLVEAIN